MKKAQPVALIGSGRLTDSPVTRLLRSSPALGPVMAPSYRLASRIANSLRAGHAAKDYAELDHSRLILLAVPHEVLPSIIASLTTAEINWTNKAVVLCNMLRDSSELSALSGLGASVGSLSPIPGSEDALYLIEGDAAAIRESSRLLTQQHKRAVAIERNRKPFYLAALTCTGSLAFALQLAASECLRHAGISSTVALSILEKQLKKTLRSYAKAGRKVYPPPRALSNQLRTLASTDPELAHYLEQSAKLATRLLEKQ